MASSQPSTTTELLALMNQAAMAAPAATLGPAAAAAGAGQEGASRVVGVTIHEEPPGRFRTEHGKRCDRRFHRWTVFSV
jgi:hypothetical protein